MTACSGPRGKRSGSRKRQWVMARVIEFYVPQNFKAKRQWVPADERGKVVEFRGPKSRSLPDS